MDTGAEQVEALEASNHCADTLSSSYSGYSDEDQCSKSPMSSRARKVQRWHGPQLVVRNEMAFLAVSPSPFGRASCVKKQLEPQDAVSER